MSKKNSSQNEIVPSMLLIPPTINFNEQIDCIQFIHVQINQETITFDNGTILHLSDIREISVPETVLGHPDHPLTIALKSEINKGHGIVYLLYTINRIPHIKIITTQDRLSAISLAINLKEAKNQIAKRR
jgi:hypothetical protein